MYHFSTIPYADATLVTLKPEGDHLISLTTTSRAHGRSERFLMAKDPLEAFVRDEIGHVVDIDLDNIVSVYRCGHDLLVFTVRWLRCQAFNRLAGRKESFDLPLSVLEEVLAGYPASYLFENVICQCPVKLSPSAHKQISTLNRLERRALSKALRDNFHYRYSEQIGIFADWNKDLFFNADAMSGGLCMHKSSVTGRDGKPHNSIRYSVHT